MGAKLPREPAPGNAETGAAGAGAVETRDRRREVALDLVVEGLEAGEAGRWRLAGDSMRPLLHPGDMLEVRPCAAPVRGQVVLFRSRGQLICHRVLATGTAGDTLELAGDHNRRLDHVEDSAVLGRVVAAERTGRRLALDHGPLARAGGLLAAWHRLDRRLVVGGGAARWPGRGLELARMALLHACTLAWWTAPRRR